MARRHAGTQRRGGAETRRSRARSTSLVAAAIAIAAVVTGTVRAQQDATQPVPAHILLLGAQKTAISQHKTILIKFSASWCGWCKQLDAFLSAPEVIPLLADHFVIVNFVVQEIPAKQALENPGADLLLKEWGGGEELPFYAFLDGEGRRIANSKGMPDGSNIGYPGSAEEIKAFADVLAKAAPRMTAADRAKISDYLTRHAPKT